MNPPPGQPSIHALSRAALGAGWLACLTVTGVAIWFHAQLFHYSGPLWRDEVSCVGQATLPTLSEFWDKLTVGSASPLLMPLLLRFWCAAVGPGDASLRVLGLLIGVASIAALWFNARVLGRRLPVLSLAFVAANAIVIRWGDTLRPYGLGTILIVLALGLFWRLAERPTWGRFLAAMAAAVLSVHALYANAFLVLAAGCAGAAVCLRKRHFRGAVLVLGAGAAAAVSLLPYVPGMLHPADWWVLQKTGFLPAAAFLSMETAIGSTPRIAMWLSIGALGILRVCYRWRSAADDEIYSLLTLVLGPVAFLGFIVATGLPSRPWYFLPIMSFVACSLNALIVPSGATSASFAGEGKPAGEGARRGQERRTWDYVALGISVLALAFLAWTYPEAAQEVRLRQTNVDLIAARLSAEAGPDDYIVIHPWYHGTTFQRYYHGRAPWTTIPPITDYRMQRFDMAATQLASPDPTGAVMKKATEVLLGGHRVWMPGEYLFTGEPPPERDKTGEAPMTYDLATLLAYKVYLKSAEITCLPDDVPGPISPYEHLGVYVARGAGTNSVSSGENGIP